jgi:hypothetical protein
MATPADRFSTARAQAEEKLLPVRLPAVLALSAAAPPASPAPAGQPAEPAAQPATPAVPVYNGGPVEFERVVPASGNMQVARRQFWLGPDRSGLTVTFWASTEVIHLLIAGVRIKTVRSHLSAADLTALAVQGGRPAGPPPLPPAEPGAAIEVDRIVSKDGAVHLANRYVLAAEILGGRRVSVRIEETTLMFFDPQTRELLRTRPNPLTWDQARRLRGARPAGPPPQPSTAPVTAQRVASNTGVIMIAGQKIALGRIHARRASSPSTSSPSTWAATTPALSAGPPPSRSAASKPSSTARLPMVPRPTGSHVLGLIRQSSRGTRQPKHLKGH